MEGKVKRYSFLVLLAKLAIAAVLVAYLIGAGLLDGTALRTAASHAWIAAPLLLLQLAMLLLAVCRWHVILRPLTDHSIRFRHLLRFTWIGLFFGTIAPTSVATDVTRLAYLRRSSKISIGDIASSVLVDRAFGVLGLVALALVFGVGFSAAIVSADKLRIVLGAGAGIGALAWGVHALRHRPGVASFVHRARRMVSLAIGNRRVAIVALALSIAAHALKLLSLWLLVQFTDASAITAFELLAVGSLGFLVEAVPLTPAGIGTTHLAFEHLFRVAGFPGGAAIYNVYFLVRIAFYLTGAAPWILCRSKNES